MLLFCIPHAGGSTLSYIKWKKFLDKQIVFVPLDLPGHITRQNEPFCENFPEALEDLYQNLIMKTCETDEEYSIFGHSLGAVFAYELYAKLEASKNRLPKNLFFSGRWPPYLKKKEDRVYKDYEEFREVFAMKEDLSLDKMSETNENLGEYFYKGIYTDLKLLDTYKADSKPYNITSEITVLWGSNEDSMGYKDVSAWREAAGGIINFQLIAGTHLFPIENVEDTVNLINKDMVKHIINY